MAQCKDCIHGEICDMFAHTRTLICADRADKMCKMFKSIADVVPKSEVDNLKVLLEMKEKAYEGLKELYDMDIEALINARKKTEVEVAREIFEEIEKVFLNNHCESFQNYRDEWVYRFNTNLIAEFAELKKKYTEEKK